jgi:hypothetical protein
MAGSEGTFRVLSTTVDDDVDIWLRAWSEWPQREVFAHPAYVSLYADGEERRAMAALFRDGENTVLYPFILQSLGTDEWSPGAAAAADIITPYGYGGPFCWGRGERLTTATSFWAHFQPWADAQGVVSEFVRFALFPDELLLPYPGEREERLLNVVRELDTDLDAMWMDFEHKVRKNVQKARRSGIVVEHDATAARLSDFLRIYGHTMDRRSANETYYFSEEFFERIRDELAGQYMFFHALIDNRVISTELVLVSEENVYSFLGGTESDAFQLRPNDLLKYEIIAWAKANGKKRFVLGGGYQPDDGIFRYKLAFAPGGTTPFFVGRRVFDGIQYESLVRQHERQLEARGDTPRVGFFPAYRA